MKPIHSIRLVCALFSLLFSCSSLHYQSPRYVKLADEITMKTAKKLQKQKNLRLVGTGGQMMYDIKLMRMGFYFYHELGLEAARKLLIDTVNEYLLEINNSKEIRPYLHESPYYGKKCGDKHLDL